jgi:hypothetical protein
MIARSKDKDLAYDVVIIGSGMGGGTLAYALRNSGLRIALLERGDFLPKERENWDAEAVFGKGRYKSGETWLDGEGNEFHPAMCITSWAVVLRSTVQLSFACGRKILAMYNTPKESRQLGRSNMRTWNHTTMKRRNFSLFTDRQPEIRMVRPGLSHCHSHP